MDFVVEHLNVFGQRASALAWPILWQSSLLIGLMLVVEGSLKRKLRPQVRYLLCLVVLAKLVLQPSLALPTSVAWWARPSAPAFRSLQARPVIVSYASHVTPKTLAPLVVPAPLEPRLSLAGGALGASAGISLALFGFLLWRWHQVCRQPLSPHRPVTPEWLGHLVEEACASTGIRRPVLLRLVRGPLSPALSGLFRPVILLPESLVQRLSRTQLRSVLLHELTHLRRGDLWVNCVQAVLQIVYWWHPLLWLANQRIRRVREEAVDEAVMLVLSGDAETYAPTLLEVARLALTRPLLNLGLVGILESQGALRQRIERLMDFQPPRNRRLGFMAMLCATAFGAVALPMGQAPAASNAGPEAQKPALEISPADISGEQRKADAKVLVQDGKLRYEMGKLDEAEKKLIFALQQDPREQAAYYYINLIKAARYKEKLQGNRTNVLFTTSGRQRIYTKLDTLRLASAEFDGVPLSAVARTLMAESKRVDPAGVGLNFIVARDARPLDPVTRKPLHERTGKQADTEDVDQVEIRLAQPLTNVRLADVLDAIVRTADMPIKYSIEDYAVVFSLKRNEPPPLYTRIIKVDPNTFKSALQSVTGNRKTNDAQDTTNLLREFLRSINVEISPPKTIFWNDREGSLFVRSTLQDLDTIETAIMVLNLAPPQLHIKARFIEVSEQEEAAFWQKHLNAKQSPSAVQTIELGREEAQKQLDEWKSKGSADVLSESSITTLSGRQTQVQVVDLKTIVTFTNFPTGHWETNTLPFGPVLDLLPTISADALRIDLAVTASVNEFLGYDDPGPFAVGTDQVGQPQSATLPVPHFRLRQLPVTASLWEGETLIIGGGLEQGALADKAGEHLNKRLLVMVTPTVIDPAGNRVHTDAEVESARSNTGVQTVPRVWRPTIPPRPVR